jgi:UDP-N-acetylmuramoyl-tripeptide--D-alanyl-D-alanine ligase
MNNAIGVPLTLLRLQPDHSLVVIELGTNHFGEIKYLCTIAEPQLGVITNIGREHLEFFKSIKGAAKAECELMDYLANYYGTYFLNADDNYLARKMKGKEISFVSYGTKPGSDIKGKIKKFNGFYPEVEIKCGKQKIKAKLNTIGSQSFNAALSAAAIGFYFDVPAAKIKNAITSFNSLTAKRNQLINANGTWLIDDTYNSNPDSAIAALENLKQYKCSGNKHVVLSDMLELGKASKKEHSAIGRTVKKLGFKYLYTYGKDSINTFRGAKGIQYSFHFEDKNSLAEMLKLTVKKGDIVLIKGSRSMKMEDVINRLNS